MSITEMGETREAGRGGGARAEFGHTKLERLEDDDLGCVTT